MTICRQSTALVTASYAPDFERCRLLCQSVDAHVTGFTCHYILVEAADVALFKTLEGPKRYVIDEREILPSWLKAYPDPFSLGRRRIWLSFKTAPLRGWHTQQLRRLGIAKLQSEDAFFYCDSDVVFMRDFDVSVLWRNSKLRLFRRDNALENFDHDADQLVWATNAANLLGIPAQVKPKHDYIGTLIAWHRDTMLALCDHIERISGRDWVSSIAARRRFSECMIYGQFADIVENQTAHFIDEQELCQMVWLAPLPPEQDFIKLIRSMPPHQVALGIQSFLGADVNEIKALIALATHEKTRS